MGEILYGYFLEYDPIQLFAVNEGYDMTAPTYLHDILLPCASEYETPLRNIFGHQKEQPVESDDINLFKFS
jgi:hypothetical protein